MDVRMPGIGGIEATAVITDRLPGTHVIVLTTFDDESLRRKAHEAGATAYLLKESSPQLIFDAVGPAAGRDGPAQQMRGVRA